jgi:nucleoside 2-deoxyribosyltransferase
MYRETSETWYKENGSCPICDISCYQDQSFTPETIVDQPTLIVCRTCGQFRFSIKAIPFLKNPQTKQLGYKLSFHLRSVAERALGKKDNSFFPLYTSEDLGKMVENRDPSVNEKLQILLKHLAGLSEYPGQIVQFDSTHDYSLLCAKNEQETLFYIKTMTEQNLILAKGAIVHNRFLESPECILTSHGWQEIERIEQLGAKSSNGFIAMWFDKGRDKVYDAIHAAIVASGYKPIRVDKVEHVNRIDDEIVAQIRRSKFLVADFTGQRNGVYFEAGFMLGLGRPVIWLCRDHDLKDVHFDTRQYNTVTYTDHEPEKLKSALQYRIEAIMGKGP